MSLQVAWLMFLRLATVTPSTLIPATSVSGFAAAFVIDQQVTALGAGAKWAQAGRASFHPSLDKDALFPPHPSSAPG